MSTPEEDTGMVEGMKGLSISIKDNKVKVKKWLKGLGVPDDVVEATLPLLGKYHHDKLISVVTIMPSFLNATRMDPSHAKIIASKVSELAEEPRVTFVNHYSTIEEVWNFQDYHFKDNKDVKAQKQLVSWDGVLRTGEAPMNIAFRGCFQTIRRESTPDCYKNLAEAFENFDALKDHVNRCAKKSSANTVSTMRSGKSGGSGPTKPPVSNNINIFGYKSPGYSRAHMIGKDPACAFFQGKPAEAALGINLAKYDGEDLLHRQRLLINGVEEYETEGAMGEIIQAVQGLRDREHENIVVVKPNHDRYFDSLEDGNIVVLPIYDLDQCKAWQQGLSYDLLVVANNEDSYNWMAVNNMSNCIEEAETTDIEKATKLANYFMTGLLDLTLHDKIPEVPSDADTYEQRVLWRIGEKRDKLDETRQNILNTKKVKLPQPKARVRFSKPVLKISLEEWPFDKYPDPYLVALKGAINLYYEGSGMLKHELRPACPTVYSEDSSSSSYMGLPGIFFWVLTSAYGYQRCDR